MTRAQATGWTAARAGRRALCWVLAGLSLIVGWVGVGAEGALGQCTPRWLPGASIPGIDGTVYATLVLPSGDILAGGAFSLAGGASALNLARWHAASHAWSGVGSGVNGPVFSLTQLPSGDVVVGGSFSVAGSLTTGPLARLSPDAETWTALGQRLSGGDVNGVALTPAGDVVAVGTFSMAGSVVVGEAAIYRMSLGTWASLGAPGNRGLTSVGVAASGEMYFGGDYFFLAGGGIARRSVAGAWSGLGAGLTGGVASAILVQGNGDVIVGGVFGSAGGVTAPGIARWTPGTGQWSGLGTGITSAGRAVNVLMQLPGGDILVGGNFSVAGGVPVANIARYSNGAWAAVGTGTSGPVTCLGLQPGGGGGGHADIVVGGGFQTAGGMAARNIVALDHLAPAWTVLGSGVDGTINAMATLPAIGGGDLFAGGVFTRAGQTGAANVARYHAATNEWSALGSGVGGTVLAAATTATGDVIVGGEFTTAGGGAANRIARWNPSAAAWSSFGAGIAPTPQLGRVNAIAVLTNGDVVAGGTFTTAGTGLASNVARWNAGTSSWSAMGAGMNGAVLALAALPSGDVVAGGEFGTAGSVFANAVAVWRGSTQSWAAMGAGVNGSVYALVALPTGEVVVGGDFTSAGGVPANYVAKWNPATGMWTALAQGVDFQVRSLAAAPAQAGGDVYVGGQFTRAGAVAANYVARYSPATGNWGALSAGVNAPVLALATHPGGVGNGNVLGDVYLGGAFTLTDSAVSANFARWSSHPACAADFDCNGTLNAQDIFAFLNAWFAGSTSANASGNGGLEVQDVFEFINTWFAGC